MRFLLLVCLLAFAAPAAAAQTQPSREALEAGLQARQDLRSPDARDAARQDLPSPDIRDAAVPAPAAAPPADHDAAWALIGGLASGLLVGGTSAWVVRGRI
jgi:hypothetical protein